jgi:hypothetical protein
MWGSVKMKLVEVLEECKAKNSTEELEKKRFACANCGVTWLELVGLVVVNRAGKEKLCLQIGMESESCQVCKMKARRCQKCSSSDVYEIRFEDEVLEVPLSFKDIRTVNKK